MIEDFTLDTDANPQNMNKLIEGINKNEEDISAVKKSVEGVSSQIGQIANDRGYVNTKRIQVSDMDSTIVNGKYFVQGYGFLDVTSHDTQPNNYTVQKLVTLAGLESRRLKLPGGWTKWSREIGVRIDPNTVTHDSVLELSSGCPNIPTPINLTSSTEGWLETKAWSGNSQYLQQTFISIYPAVGIQTRYLFNEVWTHWVSLPTSEVIGLTPLNGWANYGNAYDTLKATKTGNLVTITGILSRGVLTPITTIATLPARFTPSLRQYLYVGTEPTGGRVEVLVDGRLVTSFIPAGSGGVSFDISFPV